MAISTTQFQEMLARTSRNKNRESPSQFTPCEKEVGAGGLHELVEADCKRRLWPYVHSRTDRASTTAAGVTDFVIAASGGRVFFIELKTRTGKMTPAQLGWKMLLERNGHAHFLVRSFSEFLEIADGNVGSSEGNSPRLKDRGAD